MSLTPITPWSMMDVIPSCEGFTACCGHDRAAHVDRRCTVCAEQAATELREEGYLFMSAIYATVAQDNHGPYILFGAGESRVYRPQASSLSPGKNIYAFNKVREAAERTEFLVDTDYTVSPVKYATDFEHERYIMVYTPKRRELWCSHGSPSGGGWTPLSSTTVEEVKATEEKVSGTKNVLSKAPRLMAWMIRKGVLK